MSEKTFAKLNDDDLNKVAGGFTGGQVTSSGSFASSTGTALNIIVYWSVVSDGLQKTLNVTVSSTSYSLHCIGSYGGVELSVNGMVYTSSTPAIDYSGNTVTSFTLANFSIPNVSGALNLTAVWHFNGTYSNTPIGDVRASGTVVA